MTTNQLRGYAPLVLALFAAAVPATLQAQDRDEPRQPRRTRLMLGPQIVPRYPGADKTTIGPLVNIDRSSREQPFAFEAPDESAGFPLLNSGGFALGPAISVQSSRRRRDTDGLLPKVGFTVEVGAAVQYTIVPAFRVRAELRQGIGGHKGLVGMVGADYIARDEDNWLFSVGPRVTLGNGRYSRAYYGVSTASAATSGLRAYDPGGGVRAVGATAGLLRQLTEHWGVFGYARYDRLVDDAGDSPVVRAFGSRNQLSGGIAATYTFGG